MSGPQWHQELSNPRQTAIRAAKISSYWCHDPVVQVYFNHFQSSITNLDSWPAFIIDFIIEHPPSFASWPLAPAPRPSREARRKLARLGGWISQEIINFPGGFSDRWRLKLPGRCEPSWRWRVVLFKDIKACAGYRWATSGRITAGITQFECPDPIWLPATNI